MLTPNKKSELDEVLKLLKLDLTKKQIRKKLDIKPSALANRLRRLENLGCIERTGKYIIKVLRSSHKHPKVTRNHIHKGLNKRGHGHNIKVLFPKELNLKQKPRVEEEYKKGKLERLDFGSYKLVKDNYTIWINTNSLTIYSNNSFYSGDALLSKFMALKDMDNLIKYLIGRFEFKGIYGINVFREHYGLIFNKFAQWTNKRGGKMYVKDKGDKIILWVDKSRKDDINLDEFEGDDPQRINTADNYFDSHEKTGWNVTPEYILKNQEEATKQIVAIALGTRKNTEHLEFHAENMRSHVGAIRKLGEGIDKQNKLFESLAELIKSKL